MVFFWIIIGLLFITSIFLIMGKGAWLIAGFNTMSAGEQKKYDRKKLARAVGIMLLLTDAATVPLFTVRAAAYWIFYSVFLCASIVVLIYYANRKCFAAGVEVKKPAASGKRAVVISIIIVSFILLTGAFSTVIVVRGGRPPVYTVSMEDGTFSIESMYGLDVALSDIKSVELKTELPGNLSRTNGYGGFGSVLKGHCSSDIGPVTVFLDTAVPPFIYLTTTDGNLILNTDTEEKTSVLYNELLAAVTASQGE
jgi:flagellar basal body-associated protein FliL